MNDFLKWLAKMLLIGAMWVFIFSITIGGRSIFSYANEALVQNSVVQFVDAELADLWSRIKETARVTFRQISEGDQKA